MVPEAQHDLDLYIVILHEPWQDDSCEPPRHPVLVEFGLAMPGRAAAIDRRNIHEGRVSGVGGSLPERTQPIFDVVMNEAIEHSRPTCFCISLPCGGGPRGCRSLQAFTTELSLGA